MTSVLLEERTKHSDTVSHKPSVDTLAQLSEDTSADALRKAFSQFPSGVAALAGYVDGQREGLVASSFTVGVSLEPPLVSFAVQNTSRTWPRLRQAQRIGVSILGSHQGGVTRQIASKTGDRFANLDINTSEQGALFIGGATLWLETSVYGELPAGDHHMVLLEVHGIQNLEDRFPESDLEPLVFHRSEFRHLRTAEGNQ